jgi:hypothetical protein
MTARKGKHGIAPQHATHSLALSLSQALADAAREGGLVF